MHAAVGPSLAREHSHGELEVVGDFRGADAPGVDGGGGGAGQQVTRVLGLVLQPLDATAVPAVKVGSPSKATVLEAASIIEKVSSPSLGWKR